MTEVLVVLCTFPHGESARQIGAALVEKQVAACVNLLPVVMSIYQWEGKTCEEAEVLAVIKTTRAAYPELQAALLAVHPYETPEVVALPVVDGSPGYLEWVMGINR
ncbi:uncharacterized protein involved in tolerance to divalent cations [Haloferula luteola]|uniref:Uncharacterized protein involved in tolerance to divalent cations n=1 Tax=Haloferula luteola TaxID=595692 RepID=A0A840V6H5_9BACT|nr:divalent-cation tolerance protein CutA [Haloferula luteola]MBB5351224.1 uncharacterized protein involved in tolerance to divalent cations [Haloferula luteola]